MRLLGDMLGAVFSLVWALLVLTLPLTGVWLASSLIAFHGGHMYLAIFGGVLLFPVLPVLWEMRATRSWNESLRRKKQIVGTKKRTFSLRDRLIMRTLVLNAAFIALLLVKFPTVAFSALATRGDWFVDGRHDPGSERLRSLAFASASGLEWLHELANPNPYRTVADATAPVPDDVKPLPQAVEITPVSGARWRPLTDEERARRRPKPPEPEVREIVPLPVPEEPKPGLPPPIPTPEIAPEPTEETASYAVGATMWPWPEEVHPAVKSIAASDEASIESVAHYISAREKNPFQRVKALHDWVVTRLSYDKESVIPGKRKPQDAKSVFTLRTGVCEGYARLLVALGEVTGDRIVYVTGDVREENGTAAPIGHAWNAVRVGSAWYVMDATWDDPFIDGSGGHYKTDYLFIPPEIAALDHFPDEPRWQLLPSPLSRGAFLRQATARPGLAKEGLTLVSPERPVIDVGDGLDIVLENPRRRHVMVTLVDAAQNDTECALEDAATIRVHCQIPSVGTWRARISTNGERYGTYAGVAEIEARRNR